MDQPHIAHLVLGLPFGGTEILVERMLRNPPRGFSVSCLCLDRIGEVGERLRKDGISVTLLNRKTGSFDARLGGRIARHARSNGIDILHCHQYTPFFYGVLGKMLRPRLQVIFTEHGRFHPDIPSQKRRCFNIIMQRGARYITAVSPAVKNALIEVEHFSADRIQVVFNGIAFPSATGSKSELRTKLGLAQQDFYFILCCRFDPIKWIPGLLEALRKTSDGFPAAKLLLIGDGPEKETILAKIRELGLEGKVVMPGFQGNVAEWLRAADAFVLSSLSEGTSVSLIESMAAGLPSVVTRVGGNPYVVEEGVNGLLAPSQDAQALAEKMLSLATDPGKCREMGAAARRIYEDRFRPEAMDETYAGMYRSALGGKRI